MHPGADRALSRAPMIHLSAGGDTMGAFALIGVLLAAMLDPAPAGPGLDPGEALGRYNELREKTANTAAAQWKLAAWCEENGLAAEAFAHYAAVVRLSPAR